MLLSSLTLVATCMLLASGLHYLDTQVDQLEDLTAQYGCFVLIALALWCLARAGCYRVVSYGLLLLLYMTALHLTLRWGFELPLADLLYGLTVVFAGILLKPRAALITTSVVTASLITISYCQISHHLWPHLDWLKQDFQMGDALSYAAVLYLVGLVSWLANQDIQRSLTRARTSEKALARELEKSQLLRSLELQRFAEFGQISASLLHELVNPLTAASLNLAQVADQETPLLQQAKRNLQQMERYIRAARQQLIASTPPVTFSVSEELTAVREIMLPLARQAGVQLSFKTQGSLYLRGEPVKFSQMVANLITNALAAYAKEPPLDAKQIKVSLQQVEKRLCLQVTDNATGIAKETLPNIFEPFFSTKQGGRQNLGLGLSMVKRVAEEDFGGQIRVESVLGEGTCFTVTIPLADS